MICTPEDLSEMLKLHRRTVLDLVKQPGFPQSISGSRKPRWLMEEIIRWMKDKSVQTSHNQRFS